MRTEDVIEEYRLFYFAGQETISVLLTWTMVVLSMHQDWEARAREEVLQWYPFPRTVQKPMKLGEFKIPPGVNILIPIIYMHHDPESWAERFAEGVSKASKDPTAYLPSAVGLGYASGRTLPCCDFIVTNPVMSRA
ncbi:unnamed protein product [Spirodela intermedia]|uniref:Uncharacterized protein n=1 Tax=Spirodela intermedia TaxID=51605 RepID=A0A7I8JNI6_SPIIN|nr:unnamed protein product [Spirodela intermedia]CAA6671345.1 unnamed protein product [Spirodela intermedia]